MNKIQTNSKQYNNYIQQQNNSSHIYNKYIPEDILKLITSFQSSKDNAFIIYSSKTWYNPIKYISKYIGKKMDIDETLINYNFRYLTTLDCRNNQKFTNEVLTYLPNLTTLYCGKNENFTDEGLKYLPNLTTLDCGWNNSFTDEGLKYLPNLTTLNCAWNERFTDKGLKYLPNLTALDCGYDDNNFTDEGLKSLSNLTTLDLAWNKNFTEEVLKSFI
jgi:hypothetical protein